jgi:hypothetical protein
MQKLISFSLFGDKDKYTTGIQKNIELAKEFYPDWNVIIYYKQMSDKLFDNLNDRVILKQVTNPYLCGTMWRFLAHDEPNTSRFIIRDADSRISQREVDAVNEWINSQKTLHIMRDHPHHGHMIMGGMWGMVCQPDFNMEQACTQYMSNKDPNHWSMTDMDFLRDVIYPKYSSSSKIHATYAKFESWAEDFPTLLVDKKFVGEIYSENEQRGPQYQLI